MEQRINAVVLVATMPFKRRDMYQQRPLCRATVAYTFAHACAAR